MSFERTSCACDACVSCCHKQPGPLIFDDIQRIATFMRTTPDGLKPFLTPSKGSVLRAANGDIVNVGSITPKRNPVTGSCVFLDEQSRCRIHTVAPFGCAMFDMHMSHAEAEPRSLYLALQMMHVAYVEFRHSLEENR